MRKVTREEFRRLYARAVPGMYRAGPGERGGGSYGRRTVASATAKGASMQISVEQGGKGYEIWAARLYLLFLFWVIFFLRGGPH